MFTPFNKATASPIDKIAWALCQIIDDDAPMRWARYRSIAKCIAMNPDLMKDLNEFPKPGRQDGKPPCGECHLQPDETCDICGATADDRINEAFQRVKTEGEVESVLYSIIEIAYEIWERAECVDDFCIQTVSGHCMVFGGINRVAWGPRYGWIADRQYCTEKFIKAYNTWRKE